MASIDKAFEAGVYEPSDRVVERIRALSGEALDGDKNAMSMLMTEARQGNAFAQGALGFFYLNGKGGVPQDDGQAVHWFRHAAEQGETDAQGMMGQFYFEGCGVLKDYELAVLWWTIARITTTFWRRSAWVPFLLSAKGFLRSRLLPMHFSTCLACRTWILILRSIKMNPNSANHSVCHLSKT
jgi:hypothetical protein